MSKMHLLYDDDSCQEGPPSKRQKTAGTKSDDFENKLTLPIALELGEESRDLERKCSTKLANMKKKMVQVKIESMPILQEEKSILQKEIKAISGQIGDLEREIEGTLTAVMRTGENVSGSVNGSSRLQKNHMPTLVHLPKGDDSRADFLEEEIKRLKTENQRLEKKIRHFEEEKGLRSSDIQSASMKFSTLN
ncbi:hypothetical protein EAE96_001095 [Botrytis aclada]|nr:hypothetical protein EAE96_001095 [Botrytis aclada]